MDRWLKPARLIATGLILLMILVPAGIWFWSYPPRPGPFFQVEIPVSSSPGQLVRREPYARQTLPEGADARRILYSTTLKGDVPAMASALVVWNEAAGGGEPRPALAWAHGTIGAAPGCGASLQTDPFRNIPALPELLEKGWVFIASDYAGLATDGPHPYLIGEGEARSVLDAVRAAHEMAEVSLSRDTVVWGHSQGGHSALWAGILARQYAPEVQLKGVAAVAPATDLPALLHEIEETFFGRILSAYVARAYSDTYPDLAFDEVVRPDARWQAREMARRCLAGGRAIVPVIISRNFTKGTILASSDPGTTFHQRLTENVPDRPYGSPVLILQGSHDEVVSETVQARFAATRCDAGETLHYRRYDGFDHISIVQPDSPIVPDLIDWTTDRFAGQPAAQRCP